MYISWDNHCQPRSLGTFENTRNAARSFVRLTFWVEPNIRYLPHTSFSGHTASSLFGHFYGYRVTAVWHRNNLRSKPSQWRAREPALGLT